MSQQPNLWVILPCAGTGSRMVSHHPKQYLPFYASTLIAVTLERFIYREDVKGIVIPVNDRAAFTEATQKLGDIKKPIHLVSGGTERKDSVYQALLFLKNKAQAMDLVAVHDVARPCVRQSTLDLLFAEARVSKSGAIFAEACVQTVKQAAKGGIQKTLDRSTLYLAQTPQVFSFQLLLDAFDANPKQPVTDESSLMEEAGFSPLIVEGGRENIKVTYPQDIYLAEAIMKRIIEEND